MRQIPLVDLRAQYRALQTEIDEAVRRVIESGRFILGEEVSAFEGAFATYVGAAGAVGVASGTAALQLALEACGVGTGDEVITTSHTFIATAEAISHCGARPVFVDIEQDTYALDPNRVEQAITPRTRAILPVHIYGHPADMRPILEIADRRGLWVIEDSAQAHGAEYDGTRCGAIGHLAAFSFFPSKNLGAFGDAGCVTGTSPELLERVRKLRDHGRSSKYVHDTVGYCERLDALHAAVLGVKLGHLERWTEDRRRLAARYSSGLADLPVTTPVERSNARHVYHLYVVSVEERDRVLEGLTDVGIGASIHYPCPLHRQPAYEALGDGPFPVTDEVAAKVISLPLYPEMSDGDIDYIVDRLQGLVSA